ncbi:MAG TPA: Fe(2+) transporter permease subunit FeoB [Spirochaetia bacterium]|nr:Fe(2+) transporter permease subunit FeoB [Spirochaetia bacterium]
MKRRGVVRELDGTAPVVRSEPVSIHDEGADSPTTRQLRDGTFTVAIAGNPNCGKSTIFNGLTGSAQQIGNWPGVTVEKKEGTLRGPGGSIRVVDLPGVYNLAAFSEDERVARDFLVGGEPDMIVNVVDATNLERNLFLTLQLLETGIPTAIILSMMDLAGQSGLQIDVQQLSLMLGCPIVAVDATQAEDLRAVREQTEQWAALPPRTANVALCLFDGKIESVLDEWGRSIAAAGVLPRIRPRWLAVRLFELDDWALAAAAKAGIPATVVQDCSSALSTALGDTPDVVVADARYGRIQQIVAQAVRRRATPENRNDRVDRLLMHRIWGIPIFLGVMFLVFWITISIGGVFIPFFDRLFGAVFVDGTDALLGTLGAPGWLSVILAGGVGTGIQTVATFIPIMFFMFFMLSILEDSGYMARSAFVTDRFMGLIGLPGKAFVPLIVGFGCTVPAIMATRTLDNRRDRLLTIFMAPLMSCGGRLPVYALFAAAFFPAASGAVVFSLYLFGIVLAVLTGLLLRKSLFKGETSHLLMELPPYHRPRLGSVMSYTWERVRLFLFRAGKVVVLGIAILSFFNSLGVDGSFGNQNSGKSVLAEVGRRVTPAFHPMGISPDNWPATVSIFSGIFAKEAVVGTLNSLYAETDRRRPDAKSAGAGSGQAIAVAGSMVPYNLPAEVAQAFASIPQAVSDLTKSFSDPLGTRTHSSAGAMPTARGGRGAVFASLHRHFAYGSTSAYAYLLFILIYLPCLATMGTAMREMGVKFSVVMGVYLTTLAWAVATLYYQLAKGHSPLWIAVSTTIIAGIAGFMFAVGRGRGVRHDHP